MSVSQRICQFDWVKWLYQLSFFGEHRIFSPANTSHHTSSVQCGNVKSTMWKYILIRKELEKGNRRIKPTNASPFFSGWIHFHDLWQKGKTSITKSGFLKGYVIAYQRDGVLQLINSSFENGARWASRRWKVGWGQTRCAEEFCWRRNLWNLIWATFKTLRSSWFIYWNLSDYTNYRYIQQIMDMNCSCIVVEWDSMLI